jgi:hypothetical protein
VALSSWQKIFTRSLAAAVLTSVMLVGTAHADPSTVPAGPVVITNYAHSNYLIPDDGVGNAGTYLQVYYRADHPFPRTFQFAPVNGQGGVYQWQSAKTGTCAETSGDAGTSIYLRTCTAKKTQWWKVQYVQGTDRWVLSPYLDEGLAVTGLFGDDNFAPLRELPSPDTATASQQWFFTPQ